MSGTARFVLEGHLYCYLCKSFKPATTEFFYVKRESLKTGKAQLDRRCKTCNAEANRKRYLKDPQKNYASSRKWRDANKDRYRKIVCDSRIKCTYGLTREEYEAKKSSQNGACSMCGDHCDNLVMDHCHSTGKTRDFLCTRCNTFIGHLEKNPRLHDQAMRYISKHQGGMEFPCQTK